MKETAKKDKKKRILFLICLGLGVLFIFCVILSGIFLSGISAKESASIAVIGGADGPTAVYIASGLDRKYFLTFIALAAVIAAAVLIIFAVRGLKRKCGKNQSGGENKQKDGDGLAR